MKKHISWGMAIAACALPLLTGCSEKMEEEMSAPVVETTLLRASLEPQNATRSAFGDDGSFSWLNGDKILVQTNETGSFATFQLTVESANQPKGNFTATGYTPQDGGYAVAPANLNPKSSATGLTVKLPAVYNRTTYIPLKDTPSNMPMMGTVKNGSVGFKNLTAVVRLHVTNIPKAGCKIVVKADQGRLAGTFTVNQQEDESPCLLADDTNEAGNQVTITYKDANQPTDKVEQYFYLPLPVNDSTEPTTYTIDAYNKANPLPSDRPVLSGTKLTINGAVKRNKLYIIARKGLPDYVNEATNPNEATTTIAGLIDPVDNQPIDEEITIKNFSSNFNLPSSLPPGSNLRIRILEISGESHTIQQESSASTRGDEEGGSATTYGLTFVFPNGTISTKLVFNNSKAQLTLDGSDTTLSNLDITSVASVAVNSGVTVSQMDVTEVKENSITVEGTVGTLNYTPNTSEGSEPTPLNVTVKGNGEVKDHSDSVSVSSESKGEGSNPSNGEWED